MPRIYDPADIAQQYKFVRETLGPNRGVFVESIQRITDNRPGDSWLAHALVALALLVSPLCVTGAGQAKPGRHAVLALGLPSEMFAFEGMPVRAMRFPRVLRDEVFAAKRVDAVRDGFEVRRINARAISASMVDLRAARRISLKHAIRSPIRFAPERIALVAEWPRPNPALVITPSARRKALREKVLIRHV